MESPKPPKLLTTGFTLVEVLISVSILSLVLLLLITAFYSMSRSSRTVSDKAVNAGEIRRVRNFIAASIVRIRPLSFRDNGKLNVYFSGQQHSLRFTGALPAHRGGGGLHFMELGLEKNPPALVLLDTPATADNAVFASTDTHEWHKTILLLDVTELSFSFYAADADGQLQWTSNWRDQAQLPELVRVELHGDTDANWPALVAKVSTTSAASQPNLVW